MKLQAQRKAVESLSSVVKIGASRQVIIPKKIHDRLGLEAGDYLEVVLRDDTVILTPKALVEKRLAEALEDVKRGRGHGPFRSAAEMVRSLRHSKKVLG
jgi:AbrB family looped-hinge helix DNA binding protein